MWSIVIEHEANSGLWWNEPPLFGPTKKIHQRMVADGRIQEAMVLQAAVTHSIWWAVRASSDLTQHICPRCGLGSETLLHRLWACLNNELCPHPDVINAQGPRDHAAAGCDDNAAFWLGCLITGHMTNPKRECVLLKDCITVTTGNFAEMLRRTGRAGVDGSGGKNSSHTRYRAVGQVAVSY